MLEIANFAGTFVLTLFVIKKEEGEKGCYAGGNVRLEIISSIELGYGIYGGETAPGKGGSFSLS